MALGAIDYANSYFKYKTPTPIHGTPSNKTLKRLKTELRANASSVECDLGGGDHGYLGLVLTDADYARILPTPTPFLPPNFPQALVVPLGTDAVQALTLREAYKVQKKSYYECKNVEKALQRHIQDAIEEKYLESLVNEDTQLLQEDVPTVLEYLFDTYGKIPSEEVKQKETDIRALTFQPADPMILLFNPIEKLKTMGESAGIPYSEQQLLDMGLTVLRNTRDFEMGLGDWELKPVGDKTWEGFKTHFTKAQKQLKAIRGPTMQQAGYHHANHLAQQMRTDLDTRNTEMMSIIQTALSHASTAPSCDDTTLSDLTPAHHQANSVATDPIQLEMLQLLRQMQQGMQTTPADAAPSASVPGYRRTPNNATRPRKDTSKYCWTHGASNHASLECERRAPGHRDKATLTNRMGGSSAYCT